jgi:hypothetical protein
MAAPALTLAELIELESLAQERDARLAETDCLIWLTRCTQTKDEQDPVNPYKPFPRWEYFRALIDLFEREPAIWLPKSRTVMASWIVAGWASWKAQIRPATKVLLQSKNLDKSIVLAQYVKTLYERSSQAWRRRHPLARRMDRQPADVTMWANGSAVVSLVGDPDKVNSEHPTIYVCDEAQLVERFQACWNSAIATRALHAIALGSAELGEFFDLLQDATPAPWPGCTTRPARRTDGVADAVSDTFPYPTPCYGLTFGRTPRGVAVPQLHYAANPDLTAEQVAALRSKASSEAHWRKEMEIEPAALEGQLIYPEFSPALHVVDDSDIPVFLCRYMAIDPHPRTPHAFLWVGVDAAGDLWAYRELWPSIARGRDRNVSESETDNSFTTAEYSETVAMLEGATFEQAETGYAMVTPAPGGEHIVGRYMDTAGKAFKVSAEGQALETYASRYRQMGIVCADPIRSHQVGEDAVRGLLKPVPHQERGQWSRLHIGRSLIELILELRKARYPQMVGSALDKELPQKALDVRLHVLDCLRYLCVALSKGHIGWIPGFASRRSA